MSGLKATVSEKQNQENQRILQELLQDPDNKQCADCRAKGSRLLNLLCIGVIVTAFLWNP